MREGWESVQIEDVAKVVNGGTPKTKVAGYWHGEHLWITPAEMGRLESPYLKDSRRKLSDAGLQHSSATLVPSHSVILSTRAPIGHLIINSVPMAFNQGCRGIVPGEKIHYKYLYYFLSYSVDLLNDLGSGTTFKELAAGKLKKVQIPLPPLPEQRRIVAILDEAFSGIATVIANTEKNLVNARELFESFLNSVFSHPGGGWTECLLSEVCDFENGDRGKNYPNKSVLVARGRPFVNAGHLSEGKVGLDKMSYIPEDRYQILANGKFSPGDILFCLRGSLGKFGVVGPDVGNGAIASSLVIVRPKDDGKKASVQREFLLHYFRSSHCAEMIERFSGGAAQPNLGARDLAKFEINVPPIDEQRNLSIRLDEYFECTKYLEEIIGRKLTALTELKQSLLQRAFSGKLTAGKEAPLAILKEEVA